MSTSDDSRLVRLRSVPLFSEVEEESLRRILERATEFEAEDNHVLVQPNHPGSGLFVIEEGTVQVELRDKTIELGPGEFFGELALLDDDAVHSARVRTASDVKCLAIARDDFQQLLASDNHLALAMLRSVARRLALRG